MLIISFLLVSRNGASDPKVSAEEVKGVLEIIASTGKFWYVSISNFLFHTRISSLCLRCKLRYFSALSALFLNYIMYLHEG